jgi:hypothetical protein
MRECSVESEPRGRARRRHGYNRAHGAGRATGGTAVSRVPFDGFHPARTAGLTPSSTGSVGPDQRPRRHSLQEIPDPPEAPDSYRRIIPHSECATRKILPLILIVLQPLRLPCAVLPDAACCFRATISKRSKTLADDLRQCLAVHDGNGATADINGPFPFPSPELLIDRFARCADHAGQEVLR